MDMRDLGAAGGMQRMFRARYKLSEPGFISHVTQRAAGREPLFLEDSDYLAMLALLRETTDTFSLTVHAMCLMPNHVHLLLEPRERNLSEAMRSLYSRYAARFNRKYERRGHLFGGPYRQAVCLDNTYLLTASLYIHLNPVRAGLTASAKDYRWSSCLLYCQETKRESFIDPDPILRLVHEDKTAARAEYSRLLREGGKAEPDNALEQEGAIETFCLRLAEIFPSLFKKLAGKGSGNNDGDSGPLLDITELEQRIQEVSSDRSSLPETKEAKKYVLEQLLARGYNKTEIAERLNISRKTVYNILNYTH